MQTLSLRKTYRKYPEYKDSGVEWLNRIPEEWKTLSPKRLFKEIIQKGDVNLPLASVTQDQGVVLRSESGLTVWNPQSGTLGYKVVCEGDFVISLRSFEGGIEYSGVTGLVSPAYVVLRNIKPIASNYFKWLLKSKAFLSMLQINTRGIRQGKNITYQDFSTIDLPIPQDQEQVKIGNFLDGKVDFIDKIIVKKQKLVELLKEKRTAVINKGLVNKLKGNKYDLKNEKIKHLVKTIESGVWGENPKGDINDIKCLRIADFDYENLSFFNVETIRNNFNLSERKILRKGDILMEKSGGGEKTPVGRVILFSSNEKMVCANFIDIVRVNREKVLPEFLVLYLSILYSQRINTKYIKQNTGIQNMDIKSYFGEVISFPKIEIQKDIVALIYEQMMRFDELIIKVQKSVDILQEFKLSLISNVVTGKVRV